MKNKYNNHKVKTKVGDFDSKKEASRYYELLWMQKSGVIRDLQRQVSFELIPAQRINGKVVERNCRYIADFVYIDTKTGKRVVEDTKGVKTKDYIIKRKLMLFVNGIQIHEV